MFEVGPGSIVIVIIVRYFTFPVGRLGGYLNHLEEG
jgi:hypothetical protein